MPRAVAARPQPRALPRARRCARRRHRPGGPDRRAARDHAIDPRLELALAAIARGRTRSPAPRPAPGADPPRLRRAHRARERRGRRGAVRDGAQPVAPREGDAARDLERSSVMTDAQIAQLLALDAHPGPALPKSGADADVLVEAALLDAGFGPAGGPGHGGGGGAPAVGSPAGSTAAKVVGRSATGFKLAAAAVAIAVVVVVIAILVGRRGRAHEGAVRPPDASPDAALGSGETDGSRLAAGGSGSAAPLGSAAEPAPAPEPVAAPEPTTPPAPHKPAAHKPADHKPTDHKAADKAINDLLGEANAKRAGHEWRESDALYARVVKRAPGTLGAQTALVASGSLHLAHLGGAARIAEV